MRNRWFSKHFPTPQSLQGNRFLKPFARYLHHHFLWQFNRRTVATGVAVGLFFGILFPFLQILLAVFAAILLRANLPVAVLSTLVSNPLTFPPIYYLAYLLGAMLTGASPMADDAVIETDIQHAIAVQKSVMECWLPAMIDWAQSVGLALAVGLIALATAAALVGYFAVSIAWKLRVRWQWRRRRLGNSKEDPAAH